MTVFRVKRGLRVVENEQWLQILFKLLNRLLPKCECERPQNRSKPREVFGALEQHEGNKPVMNCDCRNILDIQS